MRNQGTRFFHSKYLSTTATVIAVGLEALLGRQQSTWCCADKCVSSHRVIMLRSPVIYIAFNDICYLYN